MDANFSVLPNLHYYPSELSFLNTFWSVTWWYSKLWSRQGSGQGYQGIPIHFLHSTKTVLTVYPLRIQPSNPAERDPNLVLICECIEAGAELNFASKPGFDVVDPLPSPIRCPLNPSFSRIRGQFFFIRVHSRKFAVFFLFWLRLCCARLLCGAL